MNVIPRSIALALVLGIGFELSSVLAETVKSDSYYLVDAQGKRVIWPKKVVTFTYVQKPVRFEGSLGVGNCDKTESIDTLLHRSNLSFAQFHEQMIEAFQRWERRVANLRFVYVEGGDADILIGAQEKPLENLAYTNLSLGKGAAYAPIHKGIICLNSSIEWGRTHSLLVVSVHEIGHAIGLTHPTDAIRDSVMGYRYAPGKSVPNLSDERAAQVLYGKREEKMM